MPRYINLEELAKTIKKYVKANAPEDKEPIDWCTDECIKLGYTMPPADVEEVRHGKWIYRGNNWKMEHAFECSVCERWMFTGFPKYVVEEYPYCHCGAKMESVEGLEED